MNWIDIFLVIYGLSAGITGFVSTYESMKINKEKEQKLYLLYSYIFSFILLTCSFLFQLFKSIGFTSETPFSSIVIILYVFLFSKFLRSYEFIYKNGIPRIYFKIDSLLTFNLFKLFLSPGAILLFILLFSLKLIDISSIIVLSCNVILFWLFFIYLYGNERRLLGTMSISKNST